MMSDDTDFAVKVELEIDESAGELDLAREKFDTALHECLFKEEVSESESEETTVLSQNSAQKSTDENIPNAASPVARPPRKRRRKENESSQDMSSRGNSPRSNKFIVRMFDRSVDLAQFDENTPLYPVCRAWLLNEPTHGIKSEFSEQSMYDTANDEPVTADCSSGLEDVHFLPTPTPWSDESQDSNILIPKPIKCPLIKTDGTLPGAQELLHHHIGHWKNVRQTWKEAAARADKRYEISGSIIKSLFSDKSSSESMEVSQ